jgi:hypothetical protein
MKKIELVPLRDKWKELLKEFPSMNANIVTRFDKYVVFTEQPLKLGMFVPCDEEGNLLEKPREFSERGRFVKDRSLDKLKEQYQVAKERVIFDGFEVVTNDIYVMVSTEKVTVTFFSNGDITDSSISDLTGKGLKVKI